jgi:hypothetical protein
MPQALSLQVKQLGYESDHSPKSNAKIKNGRTIVYYLTFFMEWCFINYA